MTLLCTEIKLKTVKKGIPGKDDEDDKFRFYVRKPSCFLMKKNQVGSNEKGGGAIASKKEQVQNKLVCDVITLKFMKTNDVNEVLASFLSKMFNHQIVGTGTK